MLGRDLHHTVEVPKKRIYAPIHVTKGGLRTAKTWEWWRMHNQAMLFIDGTLIRSLDLDTYYKIEYWCYED